MLHQSLAPSTGGRRQQVRRSLETKCSVGRKVRQKPLEQVAFKVRTGLTLYAETAFAAALCEGLVMELRAKALEKYTVSSFLAKKRA